MHQTHFCADQPWGEPVAWSSRSVAFATRQDKLLSFLGDDIFGTREVAARERLTFGEEALPAVRESMLRSRDFEVRQQSRRVYRGILDSLCESKSTGMELPTFYEWLFRRDDGLMFPDRPPLKGMIRLNAFPGTDAQRKALHPKPVKKPRPFAPTMRKAKEIVPNKFVAKIKPATYPNNKRASVK